MPSKMTIDKELQDVMVKVRSVFDKHNVDSCIVGSTATYIQLALKNDASMAKTNDVDYLVKIDNIAKYKNIIADLTAAGLERTNIEHRLQSGSCFLDIIPLGDSFVHNDVLKWPETGNCMDVSGLKYVFSCLSGEPLFKDVKWKVAKAPVQVLTKIIAYLERKKDRDLADIVFIFDQYEAVGERRCECEYSPLECCGAYLIGKDVKEICVEDHKVCDKIRSFLGFFSSASVPEIDKILREQRAIDVDGDKRENIFKLFQAFQVGVDL